MPRKPKTLADFPPEFLDAWKLAGEGKLMLAFDSAGMARNFIQRMYTYRKRLVEEAPEVAAAFYLVDLRVHDASGNVVVGRTTNVPGKAIVRPYSPPWKSQVREQISESASGVLTLGEGLATSSKQRPPEPPTQSGTDRPDNVEETLADLGYGTGEKP